MIEVEENDPRHFVLDADIFVRDLRGLDPHNWDPLPCNLM